MLGVGRGGLSAVAVALDKSRDRHRVDRVLRLSLDSAIDLEVTTVCESVPRRHGCHGLLDESGGASEFHQVLVLPEGEPDTHPSRNVFALASSTRVP